MEFTSLNDAFSNHFIKSLPHLTRLDLTANEIKIIELVLSYTRNGQQFYMNHSEIAKHLVLKDTKTKAKSVGNLISKLKKKGYVTTVTSHNFNGKNGGSSTTIRVNEAFLERQLYNVFSKDLPEPANLAEAQIALASNAILSFQNDEVCYDNDSPIEPAKPNTYKPQPTSEFIAELKEMEEMDDEPRLPLNLLRLEYENDFENNDSDEAMFNPRIKVKMDLLEIDCSQMNEAAFKNHLQKVIRVESMSGWRGAIQTLIENKEAWKLEYCKGGLTHLIEESRRGMLS
ncbi:hypothetical protein [Flavobacterium silvaticum]|uniref:Uncharacterized protein n=1 Tax=Flavobacterium silvaticum TaxID=1852020 RepID=A0A972JJB9_9FLAO|nr:hypothetical protein [Flavobacterium silvaticum]NMH28062.1 hypothetical protein [Flavobacterium silvaticum]